MLCMPSTKINMGSLLLCLQVISLQQLNCSNLRIPVVGLLEFLSSSLLEICQLSLGHDPRLQDSSWRRSSCMKSRQTATHELHSTTMSIIYTDPPWVSDSGLLYTRSTVALAISYSDTMPRWGDPVAIRRG